MCGDTEKKTQRKGKRRKKVYHPNKTKLYIYQKFYVSTQMVCMKSSLKARRRFPFCVLFRRFFIRFRVVHIMMSFASHRKKKKQKRNEMINIIAQDVAEMCKKLIRLSWTLYFGESFMLWTSHSWFGLPSFFLCLSIMCLEVAFSFFVVLWTWDLKYVYREVTEKSSHF